MPEVTCHKLRVLHVMASAAPGGGADHLLSLLPALRDAGIEACALVGDDGPLAAQLRALGVPAQARPLMGRRSDVMLGRALHAHGRKEGAAALHLHGTRAGVLGALGATLSVAPLPRMYSAHGLAHRAARGRLRRGLRLMAEAYACRGTRAVISVSQADLAVLCALAAVPVAHHVANVVRVARKDTPLSAKARAAARIGLGLPAKAPMVGTVARLVPQKNIAAAADAVALLPGAHLAVVGEGPLRQALGQHPLAQAGRLHLLGSRADVPDLLALFDAFVLSSRWEGEPIALLEAIASGLPWAATRTAGATEIAAACSCGRVVPQNNAPALAAALAQRLSLGPEVRAEIASGQQAVAARHPQALAQRLAAIYAEVLR